MPEYKVPGYAVVTGPLGGTEEWARQAAITSGGALWNNGTYVYRNVRGTGDNGTRGVISNHARGVAMDLSWRRIEPRRLGVNNGRIKALTWLNTVLDNWEVLGVQCVLDYFPEYGRGWRVDRVGTSIPKNHAAEAWLRYVRPTLHGAGGGDWFHIELRLGMASNPEAVKDAFNRVFGKSTTPEQAPATVETTTKKGGKRRAGTDKPDPNP